MALTYQQAVEQTITGAEQFHEIINGSATSEVVVEDGSKIPTVRKALLDNFYYKDPINWQQGQNELVFNQIRKFTDGTWWIAPTATATNPVVMGVTPYGDPLWKVFSWDRIIDSQKANRKLIERSWAEAGYNVVAGSFQEGATLNTTTDVIINYGSDFGVYSWGGTLPKVVPANSTVTGTGGVTPTTWALNNILFSSILANTQSNVSVAGVPAKELARKTLTLAEISSLMSAGDPFKFVCYGDSTTDGFSTTGWTANPTSGGNAVGNTNHNLTSPNSWPVKLEEILKDLYKNNNISVFNAGYSGKALADGWAVNNFETAIINNPFYGIPDAVFIDFGLNDVRPISSQIEPFKQQLNILIDKVISYGATPILLTCDPIMRNFNVVNAIYNREVLLEIDQAKIEVAKNRRIPIIQKGEIVREWANNNKDKYRWFLEQSTDVDNDGDFSTGDDVGLHFKDNGQSIKAQAIASAISPNVVKFSSGLNRITSNDARADCYGNFLLTLSGDSGANSVQGFNFKLDFYDPNPSHKPVKSQPLTTLWIWNENRDATLVYRGLVGEGWGTNSPDNVTPVEQPPQIAVKDLTTSSVIKYTPPSVGFRYSGFYKPSDTPYPVCKLKYGLNKIQYLCGDFSQYNQGSNSIFFYGFFDIVDKQYLDGVYSKILNIAPNVNTLNTSIIDEDCIVGTIDSKPLSLLLDIDIPIGCGVVLSHTSTFGGVSGKPIDGFGSRVATVIYRHDATRVRIALAKKNTDGDIIYLPLTVAQGVTFTNNNVKLRVEIERAFSGGVYGSAPQNIRLYDGFSSTTPAQTTVINPPSIPALMGGSVGGFFSRSDLNTTGGIVCIRSISQY